jgi:hypothetical protein
MAAPRNRRHLLIPTAPQTEAYRPHPRRVPPVEVPAPENRRRHAGALRAALNQAQRDARTSREQRAIEVHGAVPGVYVQFESTAGVDLKLESLEHKSKGIEVVAVQRVTTQDGAEIERATVFVPDGQLKHFITRFQEYATSRTRKGEPRHKDMLDRVAALRRASLRALWTDSAEEFPAETDTIWWELWLRRHDGRELERLIEFAGFVGLEVGQRRLGFDDRLVVLARAAAQQLAASLDVLNDLAEVRKAKESAARFEDATPTEQAGSADDLRNRTALADGDLPAVCVLDTGVNRGHPLLETVVAQADAAAVDPAWGSQDDGGGPGNMGHGTEMCGLAAYGDLAQVLGTGTPVQLRHVVESVKILPPVGANPPDLYGAITAQAVARPEINAPQRKRSFSLAVTATDERDRGEPTSWSAAIDALAAGRVFDAATHGLVYLDNAADTRRLFVVSAGNVVNLDVEHLDRSDLEAVHDPAHAWNALTVGAFTEKAVLNGDQWNGWCVVAPPGELSPWSTTSVPFQDPWPMKPDVVFEGGNVAHDGAGLFDGGIGNLCLLSTYYRPADRLFTLSYATSAATAQIARMSVQVLADYPDFWPETIRALIAHSARWTRAMQVHLRGAGGKKGRAKLVRRYGFGVPNGERARRSANDALTLVAQGRIRPFLDGKMREMHFHRLPWPKGVLEELGQTPVELRVTLSYFVEPNPGRRGWKKRHRYASHGLRFDVKTPTESLDEFRKRLNERALADEEEKPTTGGDSSDWYLGEQTRNKGSLHSDIWVGTAADLAERGVIGVYPVSGWWKDQPKRDRSALGARYALVVSIETEAEGVDIWTPVAQQIGVPLAVEI